MYACKKKKRDRSDRVSGIWLYGFMQRSLHHAGGHPCCHRLFLPKEPSHKFAVLFLFLWTQCIFEGGFGARSVRREKHDNRPFRARFCDREVSNSFVGNASTSIASGTASKLFHLPAQVFFFSLHSHFNPIVDSQHTSPHHGLKWNVSPKLPLASSVKQGNDTKYKTGGLYMIYRVTELLKIHAKFSGVSVELFIWIFLSNVWLVLFFVLLSVKNSLKTVVRTGVLGINYWIEVRMEREEEHLGRQMEANTQSGSLKHYLQNSGRRTRGRTLSSGRAADWLRVEIVRPRAQKFTAQKSPAAGEFCAVNFKTTQPCQEMATRHFLKGSFLAKGLLFLISHRRTKTNI